MPILQLSGDLFDADLLGALVLELRQQQVHAARYAALQVPELALRVASALRDQQQVARLLHSQPLQVEPGHRSAASLAISLQHYLATVARAGLLFESLPGYVEQLGQSQPESPDDSAQLNLEEMELLVEELQFLCNRLRQKLELAQRQGQLHDGAQVVASLSALLQ